MSIHTENKNGSGTIDKAIALPVVATPEPTETQLIARHMLQVTAPSALPEVRDTIYQFVNDHLSYLTYNIV